MIKIYKNGMNRIVPNDKLADYLAAGWAEDKPVQAVAKPKKAEVPMVESMPTVALSDTVNEAQAKNSEGE